MLNYIWLALIVIGIAVAVSHDWSDLSSNRYHNGEEVRATIATTAPGDRQTASGVHACTITIVPSDFNAIYGTTITDPVRMEGELVPLADGSGGNVKLGIDGGMPRVLSDIAAGQRTPGSLSGRFIFAAGSAGAGILTTDQVKFVYLQAVTSDGIIRYAKIAVELAIGLIGIMALWLGIMKIAEQSGLVAKLASLLRPVLTWLFPDVPADHPAMGAMVMNISANMLGLANAATPLGLKAMEELNKLNRKAGTATDAMCTFLVINTSNLQLIPATAIAIRASAGSANPSEIIAPVILATIVASVTGIVTVKLMARLKIFRKQLSVEG
jgi:spore maturation protein A